MMGTWSRFGSGGFFLSAWPWANFAQYPRPGTGTDNLRHVLPSATAETPYSSATLNRGFSQTLRYSSSRSYGCSTVIPHCDGASFLRATELGAAGPSIAISIQPSAQIDSEPQQCIRVRLQMLLHSRRAEQPVHPFSWAGTVLSEHLEQLNGHIRLTFKQCPSKRI